MPKLQVTQLEIHLTRPAPLLDGFRICHYSDLHADRMWSFQREAQSALGDIEADMAAFTGDLTSGSNNLDLALGIMGAIKPRLGTFVVYGNNDHDPDVDVNRTTAILREQGYHVLINSNVYLPDPGVWILGVDDPYKKHDDFDAAVKDIPPNDPKILLSHTSDTLEKAIKAEIDLVLAGHTHGGQMNLPTGKAIWAHSRYGTKLASGYFPPERLRDKGFPNAKQTHLYVSRGIGTSLVPVRLFCPAEITVITLRSG